jgi:hypothetical protein
MEETGFKFEPIWVTALTLASLFFGYQTYEIAIEPGSKFDYAIILLALIPLLMCSATLPMFFRMLFGIPAILLTADQLVDNVVGISIDWKDIQDIRITGVSKPFLSITLKDKKAFFKNIRNPLKRIFLKMLFSISIGDVSINLAMVIGNNEAVKSVVMVYWSRYYGHSD